MTRKPALDHVDTWVFDLDNTLYPADAAVMSQVDARMTEYVMQLLDLDRDSAREMQKRYWREHGTTLSGLMKHHEVDGADFLDFVHDVDHSVLTPDPQLARHISQLEGKRYVYTNGTVRHAEKVLEARGLTGLFDDLFGIEEAEYLPKPHRPGFDRFTQRYGLAPTRSAMFEDSVRNLETAAGMGFTTVLVRARSEERDEESAGPGDHPEHVHYAIDCLTTFLGLVAGKEPR